MAMATSPLVRAACSRLVRRRAADTMRNFRVSSLMLSAETAGTSVAAKGPPFKRNFWIVTGVMVGLPSVVGAAFVYNLKTDDAFYEHFSDKYPELVAAINEYVPLNEPSKFTDRDDVGEVTAASERLNETVTIVAELRSGRKARFQAQGSASQAEIETLARQHAGSDARDAVIAIDFDEDAEQSADVAIEEANGPSTTLTAAAAWPPAPRTMWTGQPKPRSDIVKDMQREINEIRVQQAALEESKYAGRDIDEADDAIRVLEERKIELKKLLPRKRFLWIF